MTDFKYLDVCSGISAPTVAWKPLGWQCVAYSEIEKFPSAVLAHHYPDIPNLGDMNEFRNWPAADINLLVGGTPCQSFSVAGLREGLKDPRGNLALTYLAIAERYRPAWLVWENVPGVLSSHRGRDFGSILGAMVELGYGFAYRVLDAQYFGVPQRRRRVFVVGYLGDWRRAAEVLFEPESLCRNPPPSREKGQKTAPTLASGSGGSCGHQYRQKGNEDALIPDTAGAINTQQAKQQPPDFETYLPDVVGALSDGAHMGGGLNGQDAYTGRILPVYTQDTADPITAHEQRTYTHEGSTFRCRNVQAFAQNQRDEVRLMDKAGALAAEPGAKQQTYVFKHGQSANARSLGGDEHIAPTLEGGGGGNSKPALLHGMAVRRLTPRECERLQGFPDDYTRIAWRNKAPEDCPDGPRYKALGNSMAVPVLAWIGRRIQEVDRR